jgi:epoxyqueuosine reductase
MNYSPELEDGCDNRIRRARYARGKDYHRIFRKALSLGARQLAEAEELEHQYRPAVDSAPLLERTLAEHAGLGWIGKNGLLLIPGKGSYHFLGFLFTSLVVEEHNPSRSADRCGSCSRCLEACPTAAIVPGRRVLSERCISYLTIEHQGVIPREMAERFSGWWFGCDICQEVCPWNRFAPQPGESRFLGEDREERLLKLKADEYDSYFAGRAIRRISYSQFRRNLLVALFSLGRLNEAKAITRDTPDELVQEQAVELGLDGESNRSAQ